MSADAGGQRALAAAARQLPDLTAWMSDVLLTQARRTPAPTIGTHPSGTQRRRSRVRDGACGARGRPSGAGNDEGCVAALQP